MTEAAKNELEDIEPDDSENTQELGRIRYQAGASLATNVVELVPVPAAGKLEAEHAKVIVASDFDTGEDTVAIGFSNIHDGVAEVMIDPRAQVAQQEPAFLHDVISIGMHELGLERVSADPQKVPIPPQILAYAGIDVRPTQQPEMAHAA